MRPRIVATVGHSDRSLEEFVDVLVAHGIARLVDVRRYPGSRRHPQFASAVLAGGLAGAGIAYRHAGALGGMREPRPDSPNAALADDAFRGYADHMATREFADALDAALAWGVGAPLALMCAERDPEHCHRSFLADAIVTRGVRVVHLLDAQRARDHVRHPAAVELNGLLVYRGAQESLGL